MQVAANGVSLEVDIRGPASGQPLVLIMGLGMQLVAWPEGFVDELVKGGFQVIRVDNRDIGLSQQFKSAGKPNVVVELLRKGVGLKPRTAYELTDMADDIAALIAALGFESAHVCGASMGGMIAQHVAARHPDRVRSLSLIMTTSGARGLPGPSLKMRSALLKRPPAKASEAELIQHMVGFFGLISSPGFPAVQAEVEERVAAALRRSYRPTSVLRQMVAIVADGDRSKILPAIKAPTQIIHGAADLLVPLPGGQDLMAKIKGAEIDIIEGMGHDLPRQLWPRFAADIRTVAGRAG